MGAGGKDVVNLFKHGKRALVPVRREGRIGAVPTPMLFADHLPEVLDMGVAGVQKCFSSMTVSEFETFVGVTVA